MEQHYTAEMFNDAGARRYCTGSILTREQLIQHTKDTVVSHNEVLLSNVSSKGRKGVRFYSTNHLFGHGILPVQFVSCTTALPHVFTPREGLEGQVARTPADLLKFDDHCNPEQYVVESIEELVDYLNTHYT